MRRKDYISYIEPWQLRQIRKKWLEEEYAQVEAEEWEKYRVSLSDYKYYLGGYNDYDYDHGYHYDDEYYDWRSAMDDQIDTNEENWGLWHPKNRVSYKRQYGKDASIRIRNRK